MKDTFSERMGLVEIKLFADECPQDVRNRVCNLVCDIIDSVSNNDDSQELCKSMIDRFHKRVVSDFYYPIYECKYSKKYKEFLKEYLNHCDWYFVYDFVEAFYQHLIKRFIGERYEGYGDRVIRKDARSEFEKRLNAIFEEERVVYRMIDGKIVRISDEVEKAAVERIITPEFPFSGAREHIKAALSHFAKRPEPDYRNAIKEAISAVESVCKIVAEDERATLGQALRKLKRGSSMHPSLSAAFEKLYGYTNDEKGIRHSLLEDRENVSESEAHFMIVACAAFVNYVANIYAKKK